MQYKAVLRRVRLPLAGEIAAGRPKESWSSGKWQMVRAPKGVRRSELFVLRVCGDSLIEAGIKDGSLAVCRRAQPQRNGELCAVLTPEGMTLKRLHWQCDGSVLLVAANRRYPPVSYQVGEISVQGVVVAIE